MRSRRMSPDCIITAVHLTGLQPHKPRTWHARRGAAPSLAQCLSIHAERPRLVGSAMGGGWRSLLPPRTDLCDATTMFWYYLGAHPDANVGQWIKAPGVRISFVPIDRRCPLNGHATEDEAEKDWQVQPVAAPHHQVMSVNYTHAGLILRHACSDHVREMSGMGHTHSPPYF